MQLAMLAAVTISTSLLQQVNGTHSHGNAANIKTSGLRHWSSDLHTITHDNSCDHHTLITAVQQHATNTVERFTIYIKQ